MLPFIMKVTIDIRCSSIAYLPMHPHGSSNKTIKHHAPLKRRFTQISLVPNKHGVNLFGTGKRGKREKGNRAIDRAEARAVRRA